MSNTTMDQAEEPVVLVKKHKYSRHFILNKPRDLNCIWMKNVHILYPYLKVWEKSEDAKLIVISGGENKRKIFSAGGDIKTIAELLSKDTPSATDEVITSLGKFYELLQFIGTMNTPVVAIMDGIIMGAGSGLIGQAPFRIATENTVYAMPETIIGSFTDTSTSFMLSRYDKNLGLYLGLTGHRLQAEDTLFCGLASHYVHSSNLEAMKKELNELENPKHESINKVINSYAVKVDHVPSKYTLFGEKMDVIESCFKFDSVEDIIKALMRDGRKFAHECSKAISWGSPTSLKVMLECIRRAEHLSFNECIRMEFRVWQRMPYTHDLKEGMMGHVAGKRARKWSPKRLEDLDIEDDIRVKIFDALETHQLHFSSEADFSVNPYGHYSLPTDKEIMDVKIRYNLKEYEDLLTWFEASRPQKFGIKQKVQRFMEKQGISKNNSQLTAKL